MCLCVLCAVCCVLPTAAFSFTDVVCGEKKGRGNLVRMDGCVRLTVKMSRIGMSLVKSLLGYVSVACVVSPGFQSQERSRGPPGFFWA